MVKIVCVHTGAAPDIYGIIENEVRSRTNVPIVFTHHTDPDIIREVSAAVKVTPGAAGSLIEMYSSAIRHGADIILHVCSSVGSVADTARPLIEMTGTRIIRIDHAMCVEAAKKYRSVAVVCTLRSTVVPSCELAARCAKELGKEYEIQPIVADGAYGKTGDALTAEIIEAIKPYADKVEALILAQASMCGSADAISRYFGLPVITSPSYAGAELAAAAEEIEAARKAQN